MKAQTILVSIDSNSALKGARFFMQRLEELVELYTLSDQVEVLETGSMGVYPEGVLIAIYPDSVFYEISSADQLEELVTEHLLKGRPVQKWMLDEKTAAQIVPTAQKEKGETRIVLRNVGVIDPRIVEEYIARDGYQALAKVLSGMKPNDVIAEISKSKLRGRGGAGFPTGKKWEFTAKVNAPEKFVICNADEGEPGTFKDRLIMEGDPHSVIEAMAICGYAVGASRGYIYIRGEYFGSIENIRKGIADAYEMGFLGKDIFGSGFDFDLSVRLGAGAYICGEETALIESIEGKPGRPRLKPPYPPVEGLYQKPTVVNNVETFANIPWILRNGADAFARIGTENSTGTKVFTLVGNVANKGLVEVPLGTTAHELLYAFGGGIPNGRKLKVVQTGGTAGSFIGENALHVPLDYDSARQGVTLGSGVILVMDETHCPVEIAKVAMEFFAHESCGKCNPCREGTRVSVEILDNLVRGKAREEEVEYLVQIADTLEQASFCGLGQAAGLPLRSIVELFREEFLAHARKEPCPVCVYDPPPKRKIV
ncbi:MAG TPA: NADH-quinone oxidoreductase subunit NuoF [Thermotogota bacterium]|nr:NADH-quinone oxidoreductase subunit NuoF [Thermotogota bacterium]HRW91382.1 NADH-quinone oxidoreductase subunit NuoF [Thermotogota bacterium]